MTANQWEKIESLFHAAVKLPVAERAAFLATACAGDATLRREVEALLAADDSSESATAILSPQVVADGLAQAKAERFTGTRINQYQILSPLGAGGMGEVFLAEDARLQRKVALKLLPASYTNDRERVRRFEQEARAASALNHPNIITIHDLGESDSGCFIVMEHVAGRTLRTLAAEPIALAGLLDWGGQVAKALSAAHAAHIIHRDIKPDNIMVRDDGYVKVLDFGLARLNTAHDELSGAMTMPGTVMGTVKYMSPEQTRGDVVTAASDIFAFGIVLYELATGQHPFIGATMFAVMQAITSQTPFAPSHLKPELPADLNALVLQMLAKDAAARPSAQDIAATLDALARGSGTTKPATNHQPPTTIRHPVGRVAERAELQAAFRSNRSSLLCIAGEPGIGKTTLVEDWLSELAATESCIIARGRCSERLAGTEAYLPLLEALESLLQHSDATAVQMRQLAPTWYAQVASLSSDDPEAQKLLAEVKAASQERMKRELASFLQAVAQAQPLVIFFDDLHWADVSTIDLVNFLAGKFDTMRVLMIVTYRPSDMLLAKHPFLQIKPDLQARGVCKELLLEFLTETEIAEYLALEFPGHNFPSEFPALIHAKTEGSPLFMADLVRYLRDRSVIANTSGAWKLEQTLPDIERELPESVRGMIERKIAQLEPEDHKLLTAASVQGYEFDSAVVAQVLNLDADEIEERLEKLERVFAFVKLTSESEFPNHELTLNYRFVHVLYQNALYAGLRATRKATLSRDVALALEACYGARSAGVANELALLWEAARDYARAADSFLQAARNAAQTNTQREALQLAQRGIGVLQKLPDTPQRAASEVKLQLICGISLVAIEGWSGAATGEVFQRACQLCEQIGDRDQLFVATSGMLAYHAVRGDYTTAFAHCNRLVQLAEQSRNPHHLAYAYYCHLVVALHIGDLTVARSWLEKALAIELGEYALDVSILGDAVSVTLHHFGACTMCNLGYFDQAWAMINEGLSLAKKSKHPFTLGRANCATGTIHCYRKEYDLAVTLYDEVFSLAKEYDVGTWLDYAYVQRSVAVAFLTPTAQALDQVRQCNQMLRAANVSLELPMSLIWQAEICGLVGQYTEGVKDIDEVFALIEQTGERNWLSEAWRVKGELLLKANGVNAQGEAENCYQTANAVAQQQSAKQFELRATTSLARLWQQQGKTTEARQMLAEIYGWFTEGFDTADLQDAKALLEELH